MGFLKGLSECIVNYLQKKVDDMENKIIHNKNINSLKLYQNIVSSTKDEIAIFDLLGNLLGSFTNNNSKLDIQRIGYDEELQFNLTLIGFAPFIFCERFKDDAYYYLAVKNYNKTICMKLKDTYYDEKENNFIIKCEIIAPFMRCD